MRFQVGDRIYDVSCLGYGVGEVISIKNGLLEVKFAYKIASLNRFIHDPDLISEELYNSPLYQALM